MFRARHFACPLPTEPRARVPFRTAEPVSQQNGAVKVTGSATLNASRDDVWKALNDPAVLVRTIPGCQRLEEVGPDSYRMTITAGVASIKGTYLGDVSLTDQQQPGFLHAARVRGGVARHGECGREGVPRGARRSDAAGLRRGRRRRRHDRWGRPAGAERRREEDGGGVLPGGRRRPDGQGAGAGRRISRVGRARRECSALPLRPDVAVGGSDFVKGALFGAGVALAGVLVGSFVTRRRR